MMENTDHTFAVCAYGESPYLEECVRSLRAQTVPTNILMATATPNAHIQAVADQYHIPLYINEGEKGITQDWNFAYSKAQTRYITIAHQDDVYDSHYVEKMLDMMNRSPKPLIFFTDYAELRNGKVVASNQLLKIKRILLTPLRWNWTKDKKWVRRRVLSLGSPICCPSVTFCRDHLPDVIFANHFRADEDWEAWERISKMDGEFLFCREILTFHRIHEDSETTRILQDHKRTQEDLVMFRKFWPAWMARLIAKAYSKSEDSNNLN